MGPGMAPAMKSFSKALILAIIFLFSSSNRLFRFSRCRMYSVALLRTYNMVRKSQESNPGHPIEAYRGLVELVRGCQSV